MYSQQNIKLSLLSTCLYAQSVSSPAQLNNQKVSKLYAGAVGSSPTTAGFLSGHERAGLATTCGWSCITHMHVCKDTLDFRH